MLSKRICFAAVAIAISLLRTAAIDRHAADRCRKSCAQRGVSRDVGASRAGLQRATQHHVVDFLSRDTGALHSSGNHMTANFRTGGVIEGTFVRPANGCTRNETITASLMDLSPFLR